ncbi:hypothetical protein NA56DRAFT_750369 [Hyaloscypha hepaticicola]|uniref:Uncharacterized protein n=1 Tax=Hyaloscypha hepaticicola TaxID=2082293 RepID=A0A2J6Q061_9HELO|nr:hypothetical protein NA56DRAFT_750369 [Hyaloscypha hepaticicola]
MDICIPVDLDDNGLITNAAMVAGSIGMQISSSGTELHSGNGEMGVDTLQPMSGWWMYETKTEDELLEEKRVAYEEKRKVFPHYQFPEWNEKESVAYMGWD